MGDTFPRQYWDDHMAVMMRDWAQGQHIAVFGPTSSGKTTLVRPLLDVRLRRGGHVIGFFNKAEDATIDEYFGRHWKRYKKWPRWGPSSNRRIMLWPSTTDTIKASQEMHAEQFKRALDWVARVGNVTLYIDETLYLTEMCGLGHEISFLHYFARSSGVTIVTSSQRPFRVPRTILSSATHAYVARTRDRDDLKRLSELGNIDPRELEYNLAALADRHDFVYANPQGDAPSVIVNTRKARYA